MRFKSLFIAIILFFTSSCVPRVICPTYSINDGQHPQEKKEAQMNM